MYDGRRSCTCGLCVLLHATSAATPTHDETNYVTVSRYTSSHILHCCNDKLAPYSKYCSIRRRIASCNVASWLKPRSERTGHESGEERERERERQRKKDSCILGLSLLVFAATAANVPLLQVRAFQQPPGTNPADLVYTRRCIPFAK